MTYEAMAEEGFTEDEINQLKAEVALARAQAKTDAYQLGLTRDQQQGLENIAEKRAREVAHDRHHRQLADFMDSLPKGEAKVMVHSGHGHEAKSAKPVPVNPALKKLLGES
jgi:predicted protein tyrosine phosphatase